MTPQRPHRHVSARQAVRYVLTALGLLLPLVILAQEDSRRVRLSAPAQRVALVIGNSQYAHAPLRNPGNDAEAMARLLQQVGFVVTLLQDANQEKFESAVKTFSQQLSKNSVGLFYFSGHGMQVNGKNYLLPVGAAISAEEDVKYRAVPADWVQERMEATRNALNMLILDACRDNPLTRQWRSGQQGLAPMQAGLGADTLIAFATQPGQVAADGREQHSPFTRHLLQQLPVPGLDVRQVLLRVRAAVVQETGGKQRPQEWDSRTREFRFVEAAAAPATGPQVAVGVYPPSPPPEPSKTLRNSMGMDFVLIPAGEFQMGSNAETVFANEKPVHTVRISRAFYLGKYEVTQGQWQAVMGNNPSRFKGDANLPVENISWEKAQEFIRRLNARENGVVYRLPTEAEWEYAARAGTTTEYSFGNDARQLGTYAWYYGNAGEQTYVVGQKQPNTWGLYDMHGNVWEWVHDWYGPYTAAAVVNPTGPTAGSSRVLRGGGWIYDAADCRSANRDYAAPGNRDDNLGLRLLREVP